MHFLDAQDEILEMVDRGEYKIPVIPAIVGIIAILAMALISVSIYWIQDQLWRVFK